MALTMEVILDQQARQEPLLPSDRAFVLQLYADATRAPEHFRGRVEHIASGAATHFETVAALLAFSAPLLTEARGRRAEEV